MSKETQAYIPIDASPVKSFFVSMLTRDIRLEDAILDLLDNCVDGILRSRRGSTATEPYKGYKAEIEFKKDLFTISDNCGGIPWRLHAYAFRMGRAKNRPPDAPGTVGVYGIGMKRAIFKMGASCLLSTQHGTDRYEVHIKPEWIANEEDWHIPVRTAPHAKPKDGTTIVVGDLYPGIATRFGADAAAFKADLIRLVATHYAFIIDKGFAVIINGTEIKPSPTRLVFNKGGRSGAHGIRPFIYETRTPDGVDVFLAVGFTRPIPSQEEVDRAPEQTRYSSIDAGWTILCNDRAVLYCDRSELTGWGEAGIPRYHTQFIAISGIVEFTADDASKLPTTTTKRGIDASSRLYLQVKNKMREGLGIFVDYTNKWKGRAEEAKKHMGDEPPLTLDLVRKESRSLRFTSTRHVPYGRQYRPALPLPPALERGKTRISFAKDVEQVKRVAEHLFDDVSKEPAIVGSKCFDLILREASR